MNNTLIKQAFVVNEGKVKIQDVRINRDRIEKIADNISAINNEKVIQAHGLYLLPGMIDDQVHFREPGLTHKGTIASESRAAVAGGITSFMEMPNVNPSTTTLDALEDKYQIARQSSLGNYAFYLGATEKNLEQIKKLDPNRHCGVKVFMGASTGDLLVEHPQALDDIFRESPTLIVTHCENGAVIANNHKKLEKLGRAATIEEHPYLRDVEACFASSSYAVDLAKKHKSQLHVLHITTEKELCLFDSCSIENKHITAEVCTHHLWFTSDDYTQLGNKIKCNPAIKAPHHKEALLKALQDNRIDIIATDHAPHTLAEKMQSYTDAPAGLPLVEHALLSLFDHVQDGRLSLPQVVEKTAHNPALRYKIAQRGFIREGYFADLVLVNFNKSTAVHDEKVRYHCGWSPYHGHHFSSTIESTWVNGQQVYDGNKIIEHQQAGKRLEFCWY